MASQAGVRGGDWDLARAYVSHTAVRLLARFGFHTNEIPRSTVTAINQAERTQAARRPCISAVEAAKPFAILDGFLQDKPLTIAVDQLETALGSADLETAIQVANDTAFDHDLIDAALIIRERIGVLDPLIHAAVITQTIPLLLEEGEQLVKRPSLAADNDAQRIYDLETNLRVAEFTVAQWKGADGLRQRGLVADLAGLALDDTGRRRQLFVVGELPQHFLQTSRRTVVGLLSKAALRLRQPDVLTPGITVAEFTKQSGVEIVDLAQWFPRLAADERPLGAGIRPGREGSARSAAAACD